MKAFRHDGVRLAYLDEGAGPAVLLIHGFASSHAVNWVGTGWVKRLTSEGFRVLAIDNRGHGASEALYEPDAYQPATMAADAIALLDHEGLERAALIGYSMGARISAFAALGSPERLTALVLGGLADNIVHGLSGGEAIAAALLAPSAAEVSDPVARGFRVFAEQTRSDRRALAACIRSGRQTLTREEVGRIATPTLVVAGENDTIAGSADALAGSMPDARALTLAGRDHMSAVGDRTHQAEAVAFLRAHAG